MRRVSISLFLLLAACAPAEQAGSPAAVASAAASPALHPVAPAAEAAAAPQAQPPKAPPGSVVLACTPIEDRPPPNGQTPLARPFSILLDPSNRPIAFVGGTLPAKIPYKVASIDQAKGPPQVRVGAIIRYAARDQQSEMHTELAIMQDGTYRLGLMLKTPTQSTGGAVDIGHGTCVSKPA